MLAGVREHRQTWGGKRAMALSTFAHHPPPFHAQAGCCSDGVVSVSRTLNDPEENLDEEMTGL